MPEESNVKEEKSFDSKKPNVQTHQNAEEYFDQTTFIIVSLREFLMYLIFFFFLCIAAFGSVNTSMYYYTHVMKKLFTETKFTSGGHSLTMTDINTMLHVWDASYLTDVVVSTTDWNYWYSDYSKVSETSHEDKNILYDNRIIGAPRLRQVRVTNTSCSVPYTFEPIFENCYGFYSTYNEERGSIVAGIDVQIIPDKAFTYSSPNETGSYSYAGVVSTYGGGGFYKDLSKNSESDRYAIISLKNHLWLNRATRALFVDLTTFNANTNVFCFVKLVFEFPPTGGVIPSSQFDTMKLIRYYSYVGFTILFSEIVLFIFNIYFISEEIVEIRTLRGDYFYSWETVLDITIIALLVTFLITCLVRASLAVLYLDELVEVEDKYVSFDSLILTQKILQVVCAILVFFATLKLLRYLKLSRNINRLLAVINTAAPALLGFTVIFLIVLFSFAWLGHLLFGSEVLWLNGVLYSMFSLHLLLLGIVPYQDLVKANRILGPLYFCTFIFVVFFILLNMFLAILNERFWTRHRQIDLEIQNLCEVIKSKIYTVLSKCGLKKVAANWQRKLENKKGEHRMAVLRKSLTRAGFSDEEIYGILDQYEINEDTLAADDAKELIARLQRDLQNFGMLDTSAQERLVQRIDALEETLNRMSKSTEPTRSHAIKKDE